MRIKRMILPLCILIIGVVVCYQFRYRIQHFYKEFQEEGEPEEEIDFSYWQQINPDVYAWIRIEDTQIDYPIVQCEEDGYYLKHDVYKDSNIYGAIYTEKRNSQSFQDVNTVIYGHHMRDKSMFGVLGDFLDEDFFQTHQTIKIFTPTEKRIYQVVAAYEYPAEHLLASFDLSTAEAADKYMEQIPGFVHEAGGRLTDSEVIRAPLLTLSTCTPNNSGTRYLVQAVLVEQQLVEGTESE